MLGPAGPSRRDEPVPASRRLRRLSAAAAIVIALSLSATPASAADDQDLGDAPTSFDVAADGPARAGLSGPRLGSTVTADAIDAETGGSANASDTATGDRGDDAVGSFGSVRTGRLLTVTRDVAISRITGPTRVCGWIDFDQSGTFTDGERTCADTAAGDTSVTLSWRGQPDHAGNSYARLRIGTTAADVEQAVGRSADGEVEDYRVEFVPPPVEPEPELTFTVTAAPTTVGAVGDLVTYTLTTTNTGQTPLTGLTVVDELPGLSPLDCGDTTALAVGDSVSCTATRPTTQDDLDLGSIFNVAQVSAEAPGGDPADPSDDVVAVADAVVGVDVQPALQLRVAADPATAASGDQVSWTLRATNTGNVTLDGVRIDSELRGLSGWQCRPRAGGSLAPDAVLVCTGTYTVTTADGRRGSVTAKASVRAEPPYGDPTDAGDDVTDRASATLTVTPASTPTVPGTPGSGPSGPPAGGDDLADTGSSAGLAPVGLIGLLLVGGAALVLLVGRRRH